MRDASTNAVSRGYLLSNKYRKVEADRRLEELRQQAAQNRKIMPDEVDMTNMRAFYILAPEYLYAARDEIVKRYGSMQNYIRKGLGIDDRLIETLRNDLLEE